MATVLLTSSRHGQEPRQFSKRSAALAALEDPELLTVRMHRESSRSVHRAGLARDEDLMFGRRSPSPEPGRRSPTEEGPYTARAPRKSATIRLDKGSKIESRSGFYQHQDVAHHRKSHARRKTSSPEPLQDTSYESKSSGNRRTLPRLDHTEEHFDHHLPQISGGKRGAKSCSPNFARAQAKTLSDDNVQLPQINSARDTHGPKRPEGQPGPHRHRHPRSSLSEFFSESPDVIDASDPFWKVREAIRRELLNCTCQKDLKASATAAAAVLSEGTPRYSEKNGSLAGKVRALLWYHDPRMPHDVKKASFREVLREEVERRGAALEMDGRDKLGSKETARAPRKTVQLGTLRESVASPTPTVPRRIGGGNAGNSGGCALLRRSSTKEPRGPPTREDDGGGTISEFLVKVPEIPWMKQPEQEADGIPAATEAQAPTNHVTLADGAGLKEAPSIEDGGGDSVAIGRERAETNVVAGGNIPTSSKADAETSDRRAKEAVFKKFVDDGTVHHDEMPRALELLGFTRPVQDWIDSAFYKITKYSTIGIAQFVSFVKDYEQLQLKAYTEAFNKADEDKSGTMDTDELSKLLLTFGIEPMRHVLAEVILEVDEDQSGHVDMQEFFHVMELLRGREGFQKETWENYMDAFHKFDRDDSDEIDSSELVGVLNYVGYATSPQDVETIIKEVDVDGSGTMNEHEFLMCMRKVRDRELEKLKKAISASDADGSGTIGIDELKALLQSLGYFPDIQAVNEASADVGIDANEANLELDLSLLWQLLQVYRDREGMSRADAEAYIEAFKKHSQKSSEGLEDEIATSNLNKAVRYMGYPLTFEQQNLIAYQVDIDGSGLLCQAEFRKMVRMCREREIQQMQAAFAEADVQGKGVISAEMAQDALKASGYVDARGEPPVMGMAGMAKGVDLFGYVQVGLRQSGLNRRSFRDNYLFSYTEIQQLKARFNEFDKDGSGDIGRSELIRLIEQVFPEMSSDPQLRPRLMAIMQEVDTDGSGDLDFQDFCRLFRLCNDMQIVEKNKKLVKAEDETRFLPQEIQEFRKLFLSSDMNQDHEISLPEFKKMIAAICPMGDRNSNAFSQMFREVCARQCFVEGKKDHADFPEFIWLMRRLLDTNFGGIKEKTAAGMADKQAADLSQMAG